MSYYGTTGYGTGNKSGTSYTTYIIVSIVIMTLLLVGSYFAYVYLFDPNFSFMSLFAGGDNNFDTQSVPSYTSDTTSPAMSDVPITSTPGFDNAPADVNSSVPSEPSEPVVVTQRVIPECPPCNVTCPPCPECDTGPLKDEIGYLKDMARFLGTIARRENAINTTYMMQFPGVSVLSVPKVQSLNYEYNYLRNEFKKNPEKWSYFQNNFAKITGIPSHPHASIM